MIRLLFAALAALCVAVPARATVIVSTNPADFTGTDHTFRWDNGVDVGSTYTLGGVTFSAAGLTGYNDAYGMPYLATNTTLTITTELSRLGLYLGGYYGPMTTTYSVDGITGSISGLDHRPQFIGFSGLSGLTTITFTSENNYLPELDVIHFLSADGVPEPSTWAMMLLGLGLIGLRYRSSPGESRVVGQFENKAR